MPWSRTGLIDPYWGMVKSNEYNEVSFFCGQYNDFQFHAGVEMTMPHSFHVLSMAQ